MEEMTKGLFVPVAKLESVAQKGQTCEGWRSRKSASHAKLLRSASTTGPRCPLCRHDETQRGTEPSSVRSTHDDGPYAETASAIVPLVSSAEGAMALIGKCALTPIFG
jgi:hypothetical protein